MRPHLPVLRRGKASGDELLGIKHSKRPNPLARAARGDHDPEKTLNERRHFTQRAVSRSLTPPEWRNRLPIFAKVREDASPEIRGDADDVVTAEIAATKTAHLVYWAFLTSDETDPMSRTCSSMW